MPIAHATLELMGPNYIRRMTNRTRLEHAERMRQNIRRDDRSGWVERLYGQMWRRSGPATIALIKGEAMQRTIRTAEFGKLLSVVGAAKDLAGVYTALEKIYAFKFTGSIMDRPTLFARLDEIATKNKVVKEFLGRLNSRPFTAIPWANEAWWAQSTLHLLHKIKPSKEFPGTISYFPDARKFAERRRLSIKPGKYLTKYFGRSTGGVLDDNLIRHWSGVWINVTKVRVLHMTPATTEENKKAVAELWRDVYARSSAGTCMTGHESVMAYAHPGNTLRLSYFTDTDKPEGIPIARCIVRDDQMKWIRCYPDDKGPLHQGLKMALETLKYERGNLNDVHLEKIPFNNDFRLPYIDAGNGGRQRVAVLDDYLLAGEGDFNAAVTSGIVGIGPRLRCTSCEGPAGTGHHQNHRGIFCRRCWSQLYVIAFVDNRGERQDIDRSQAVQCADTDDWYWIDATDACGIYMCAYNGTYHLARSMVMTPAGRVVMANVHFLDVPAEDGSKYAISQRTRLTHDQRIIYEKEAVLVGWHDGENYLLHMNDRPEDFLPEVNDGINVDVYPVPGAERESERKSA